MNTMIRASSRKPLLASNPLIGPPLVGDTWAESADTPGMIDCPAGITLASESVFAAADALVVPTIPTTLSKRTLDQLTEHLAAHPPAPLVLPFISMFDRRKRLQRELVAKLATGSPPLLPTAIPNASVVELMGLERAPLATYAPTSPAAAAFRTLWQDIAQRIW